MVKCVYLVKFLKNMFTLNSFLTFNLRMIFLTIIWYNSDLSL